MNADEALRCIGVIVREYDTWTQAVVICAILTQLQQDAYDEGWERAKECVTDWYEPQPPGR